MVDKHLRVLFLQICIIAKDNKIHCSPPHPFLSWMKPRWQDILYLPQNISHPLDLSMDSGFPFPCLTVPLRCLCLVCSCELHWWEGGHGFYALGNHMWMYSPMLGSCICASARISMFQRWLRVAMVPTAALMPPSVAFLHTFSSVGEALVQVCLLFFFQTQTSLYYHNKNKSVLYFTIYFKYFHYEAWISPTWSRSV